MANELTVAGALVQDDGPSEGPADDSAVPGYVPAGWEDIESFLKHVRDEFSADAGYDKQNRLDALEDLKFLAGDQWDPMVKAAREKKGRPCLTINVLPQFVGQVIGDRRLNKTSIKVSPKKDGTAAEAEIRSGIIRGIEAHSRADRAYDATCEDQVSCGIGNLRVDMEYAANDVFDQDILVRHIPNPLAVVWDRMSVDPTGRDARHCFVQDILPRDIYNKRFPNHPAPTALGDDTVNELMGTGWVDNDVVRITEFWEMIQKPARFALMADGDVKEITGQAPEEYEGELWRHPTTGQPKVRDSYRTYARMHLVTGFAILSEAYELPLSRLPIIKAEGRVIRVGDDRVRFGLVRFARDSQRLKNYWRSVAAETLALAPKAQWVAADDAVEGREDDWRNAHQTGDTLLVYNKKGEKPERADPPTVPAALLQEAQMNQQDIKDTTGLQDASLGMRSNEISGRAIQARQKEGDVATVIYHDNLNAAILEVGDVVNELLPLAYDSTRQVLVVGPDDERKMMLINDPNDERSPAISSGKYDVSLETGPSFSTQRQEAREAMTTLVQTAPDLFTIAGDLLVKNMDWPGAHEISERLKMQMKKQGVLPPDEEDLAKQAEQEPSEEEQAAAMLQQAQLQDAMSQLEHAAEIRDLEVKEKRAALAKMLAEGDAMSVEVAKAKAELVEAQANAMRARSEAKRAEVEARVAPAEHAHKMDLAERAATAKGSDQTRGGQPRRKKKTPPKRETK